MPTAEPGARTKGCPKCGRILFLFHFGRSADRPDGLNPWCKECCRASGQRRRDRTERAYDRSRERALQRLKEQHPDEFERFFTEELARSEQVGE